MGVAERREREREEVRQKILDAARELFMSEGYEKVTMRRIAEAIEYSPTAIYLHFEDKDDLVLALCREDFGRLLAVFEKAELPRDPVDRIRQLGRAYARFGLENPNHYRFMFMTPRSPEHKPEAHGPRPPVVRVPPRGGQRGHRERRLRQERRGHGGRGALGLHPRSDGPPHLRAPRLLAPAAGARSRRPDDRGGPPRLPRPPPAHALTQDDRWSPSPARTSSTIVSASPSPSPGWPSR